MRLDKLTGRAEEKIMAQVQSALEEGGHRIVLAENLELQGKIDRIIQADTSLFRLSHFIERLSESDKDPKEELEIWKELYRYYDKMN